MREKFSPLFLLKSASHCEVNVEMSASSDEDVCCSNNIGTATSSVLIEQTRHDYFEKELTLRNKKIRKS